MPIPVKTCFVIFMITILSACHKKDNAPDQPSNPGTNSFEPCNCEGDSTEYIRGYFNDVYMCFNTANDNDTFSNAYFKDTAIQLDQINMVRQNSTRTMYCEFFFSNSNMQHQSLPYTLPHPNLAYCEHVSLTLLDMTQPWASACQGCEMDDADYFGDSWYKLTTAVTDTSGGYLKGTFKGRITTKTGRWMYVDKGEFNVRIIHVSNINSTQ